MISNMIYSTVFITPFVCFVCVVSNDPRPGFSSLKIGKQRPLHVSPIQLLTSCPKKGKSISMSVLPLPPSQNPAS